MGILSKIKESLKKRKEEKIARELADEEAKKEIENLAVDLNKEVLDIYSQINEVDAEKRAELAGRADTCIKRYLDKVYKVQAEIEIAKEVYESYKNDDHLVAHLSDQEMERELNYLMTEVNKKEIAARQLNASFKAAVSLKSVFEGEQNFVNDKDMQAVIDGKKSYDEIYSEARYQAENYHGAYFSKSEPIFSSEMLSFIGKVASAVTMAQGIAENNPAKTVAGAMLYRTNSKIDKNKENEQEAKQKGED